MSRTDRNPSPKSVPRSSPTPSLWPLQLRFLTGFLLAFLLAVVALLLLKAPTLRDPHYWDALGCYVFQGRFMAAHGLDFAAYKTLPFVRPLLFTGLIGLCIRFLGDSPLILHVLTVAVVALLLPTTFLIARRLGATVLQGVWAAVILALSPMFMAQAGQVQTDLPMAVLLTLAWAMLLLGRTGWFVLWACLAVGVKESAYVICVPAALLLYARALAPGSRSWFSVSALRAALPAALPGLTLVFWLVLHGRLTGALVHSDHVAAVNPRHLSVALLHNFVLSGRLFVAMCAALSVRRLLPSAQTALQSPTRTHQSPQTLQAAQLELLASLTMVVSWPLLFPATLPRYMLPTLPLFCALAGVGIGQLPQTWRRWVMLVVPALLVLGWHGLYVPHDVAHLEAHLGYRQLLGEQHAAAQALAGAHPKGVLSDFPMVTVLKSPPEDGLLEAPIPAHIVTADEPLAFLCAQDFLVVSHSDTAYLAQQRLQRLGALQLWQQFGPTPPEQPRYDKEHDFGVRLYRIRCPQPLPSSEPPAPR